MPNKGQILLPLALMGQSNANMLTFQSSSNNIMERLARSITEVEELGETTPEYCVHPSTWYRDVSSMVGFECDTNDNLFRHGSTCSISCSHPTSNPNLAEISCSCTRRNGKSRNRCKWMPDRRFNTPHCSKPIVSMQNLRNSRRIEQKVPFSPFHDIDVYTKSQANAMEEMGIVDEKPLVRGMENMKEYLKQEKGGVNKNTPLARSNFQLIDIWNKLQNENNVYEIPYKFSTTFAYPDLIRDQIRGHLEFMNGELSQCIRFTERNDPNLNTGRLNIVSSGRGCWSYIGRVQWEQDISLGDGCHGRGRALHEFMHALGFLHEHQRPDRDEHVKVNFHNVKDGRKDDLKKFDSLAPGNAPYDPYSLMHYGTEAFSKNGKPTIVFKDENVLAGVNGNNGQRMRPTTMDQIALCKLYGCADECGNELSQCDDFGVTGQEYFSTRKCDGFNDCSDGSDEAGCERACCSDFTFRGETFKLQAGKYNQHDYFLSDGNTYIYFHSDMGFWLHGSDLGSDSAEAFAEFDAGTCTADIKSWHVYDHRIGEWALFQNDGFCLDNGAKPTFVPALTTPAPFDGCKTTLLGKILNNPHATFDCDEKIRAGETCKPTCPTGTMLVCDEEEATCGANLKWVTGAGKPYMCKCKEPVCDIMKFSRQQTAGGHSWDCDFIDANGKVPAGGRCKPTCNNENATPLMKYGVTEFQCAQNGHQVKWIHKKEGVPSRFLRWATWRKSKVVCAACKTPQFATRKARTNVEDGVVECTDGMKMGSTCKLQCPADKVLVCQGPKEQTCQQSRPNVLGLAWSTQLQCRCDSFNPGQAHKLSFNCSLGLSTFILLYRPLTKILCRQSRQVLSDERQHSLLRQERGNTWQGYQV